MNNILLTGANGFLGGNILKNLKSSNKFIEIDLNNLDISNFKKCKDFFANKKIDIVIHAAAAKGAAESFKDPKKFIDVNFYGTLNILEAMRINKISKKIFISSSGIYGRPKKIITEKYIKKPFNPYSLGKNLSETIIQYYAEHYDLKYVNIRPNLISGFGLTKDNLVYDIVKSIIENKNAIVFGKGLHIRQYTHPDDISSFIKLIIKKNLFNNQSYNISNNKIRTIQLIKKIIKILGKGKIEYVKKNIKTFDLVISNNKAKNIGWKPKRNLKFIINEMIKNLKNDK